MEAARLIFNHMEYAHSAWVEPTWLRGVMTIQCTRIDLDSYYHYYYYYFGVKFLINLDLVEISVILINNDDEIKSELFQDRSICRWCDELT